MVKKTIDIVKNNNICVSCGTCAAVCPKKCIQYNRQGGIYTPTINENECIKCGMCYKMCPSIDFDYLDLYRKASLQAPEDIYTGNVINCYTAYCKDPKMIKSATSGGVIVTIIRKLLQEKRYDCAFLADSFNFDLQAQANRYDNILEYNDICKSKYVFVSQERTIKYILGHRDEKIILVGTPCFFHAFQKVVATYSLNRNNYLMIGLFCDKSLSYNFIEYFEDVIVKGSIKKLYFRNKEAGGWPGNIQVVKDNGEKVTLPAQKRMEVKDYFCPERCHYCMDKLNQFSDISVGDNYTGLNSQKEGSSCIIVRTNKGVDILENVEPLFVLDKIPISVIQESQHILQKAENHKQALLFSKKTGLKCDILPMKHEPIGIKTHISYFYKIHKTKIGRDYPQTKVKLQQELKLKHLIAKIKTGVKK